MIKRILCLIVLSVMAYGCGSTKLEESVILKRKEPVGANYIPEKLYKKPSDIEGIDSIVGSKKNPFRNGTRELPIELGSKNDSVYKP
ncbi:hypothetical protein SAMN05421636_108298 [Pricia antarctica]|uniref:Uncharacterized protein n=1 Tax=Pricia antarctica TaxID=641691 RepID=A0A1G7GUX5_9FLAO|nr:hypothetical protein [Pricia antarctica]SDE91915.1 hypothetical protein SAMN05421636_108298 [Pricia antarctica]